MKRFASILKRERPGSVADSSDLPPVGEDTPEAGIVRGVRLFCESGGPGNSGEEVLHLPGIVETAESSPSAATAAARVIRKFLATDNSSRAYVQYNAVMLTRILADNPGQSFTRNIDSKFVATVKKLLQDGRDMSVQQILRETLDNFQTNKGEDETLKGLLGMWSDYKAKMAKRGGYNPAMGVAGPGTPQGAFGGGARPHGQHRSRGSLPAPHELASRIEEARTSAKLLTQVVQSTAPDEVLNNDLLKEFVSRCSSASRSVQGYINAQDPPPDEDTLLTLIETNDQLSAALSRHQRAMLQARKAASQGTNGAGGGLQQQPSNGNGITPGTGAQLVDTSAPGQNQWNNQGVPTPPPGAPNNQTAEFAPPPGAPPQLGMPQTQDRLENPFDDSNKVNEAAASANRPDASAVAGQNPGQARAVPQDENEAPSQQRKYRF